MKGIRQLQELQLCETLNNEVPSYLTPNTKYQNTMTGQIFLKSVERRERAEGEDFAICRFATLKGGANRISNEPDVAEALEGTWVEGEIIRADVKPYKNDFEDGKGEQTLKVRNVVVYKGETLEAATIASGHELARKPKAVLAEAGADADQE